MSMIEALLRVEAYPHAVDKVEKVETHISWVFLAGAFVYKVKKPVDFGFVDFSTEAKRRYFCHEELRLNRRLAPRWYLEVVPIVYRQNTWFVGGEGEVVDHAVKMRRFPEHSRLDRLAAAGCLDPAQIDAVIRRIAAFHGAIPAADVSSSYGEPLQVLQPMLDNIATLSQCLQEAPPVQQVLAMESWIRQCFEALQGHLRHRKATGYIRECHGDLHLGNMAWVEGEPLIFDCLEFNPALRWIDVSSELAFFLMDLDDRGRRDLSRRALDLYLQSTADYAGLPLLRFYQHYRALVRAKVACLRWSQQQREHPAGAQQDVEPQHVMEYVRLAESYMRPLSPGVIITVGFSGSGKTRLTSALLEQFDVIRVRSDVERKRLAGLEPEQRSGSQVDAGIYQSRFTEVTYQRLAHIAEEALKAGWPVLVDATFLSAGYRSRFQRLAEAYGVPFVILFVDAPREVLFERVRRRLQRGGDASEATAEVLESQLQRFSGLSEAERHMSIMIDTAGAVDVPALAQRLVGRLSGTPQRLS